MKRVLFLLSACAVALGAACADPREMGSALGPTGLGSAVVQEGVIYTPAGRSPEGCLLYSIHIPGGQAPATLVYRSMEGSFSYDPPDRCVTAPVQ